MRKSILALLGLLYASTAQAACTGAGLVWNCAAGSTLNSDVNNTLLLAADGATITFANGAYDWSNTAFQNVVNTKGVTLICATVRGCTVNASGMTIGMNGTLSGDNYRLYRISGFVFNGGGGTGSLWFYADTVGSMYRLRIDNNTFNMPSGATAIFFGSTQSTGVYYGVIDHNIFSSPGNTTSLQWIGLASTTYPLAPDGTWQNMFFEDNTHTVTTMDNVGKGCTDTWGGASVVYRKNASTNCLVTTHGATHSGGPSNFEVYQNTMTVDSGSVGQGVQDCFRCFHHQGSGQFYAFGNRFTAFSGKNSSAIDMADYRAFPNAIDGGDVQCDGFVAKDGNRAPTATYRGYPCWHQPGRDFATNPNGGNLKPMYVWDNAWSDALTTIVPMNIFCCNATPDYTTNHLQANRDYYNAVAATGNTTPTSPFNGTTGMGFGTLANRPATCTTNTLENGGGVGYFATDIGTQGVLYRCSATNTWIEHYRPYPYPHPLVSGVTQSRGVGLSWTASTDVVGVTGYRVYRGGVYVGTAPTNSFQDHDPALAAGTLYTYTVQAFDAAGNVSGQSISASATPAPLP